MLKQKALQKKLIKTAVIVVLISAILLTAAAYIYSWSNRVNQELQDAERKLSSTEREISSREEKSAEAEKYVKLYSAITQKDGQGNATTLNRELGQKWLQRVGADIGLLGLEGNFNPIQTIGGKFQKEFVEGITAAVKLSVKGMTDEQLIQFLVAIEDNFPGFVKLISFQLQRQGTITNTFLRQVSTGTPPVLVTGDIEFEWVGLREIPKLQPEDTDGVGNEP